MTIDSDTIAAEQWCEKHECHLQMSCHVDAFLAGVTHANKKLEQVAREAFRAARIVDGTVTNYYRFETEDDYLSSKSKEGK